MEFGTIVVVVIILAIVIRVFAGGMDGDRVREYIEANGGRLISSDWAPFGPGWFGEKNDRIYEVHYVDRAGNTHHAHCKTSLFTGVYFTEDRIISSVHRPQEKPETESRLAALERENNRLREELRRANDRQA